MDIAFGMPLHVLLDVVQDTDLWVVLFPAGLAQCIQRRIDVATL